MEKQRFAFLAVLVLSFYNIHSTIAGNLEIRCVVDLALLVDKSGSIIDKEEGGDRANWDILKNFLFQIYDSVELGKYGVLFSTLFFANQANVKIWFNSCHTIQCLRDKVDDVQEPRGTTNTDAALKKAMNSIFTKDKGDRPDVRDVILIITDGKPNPHDERALNETVRQVKAKGIRVIGVGVGNKTDHNVMRDLVSSPYQQYYFETPDYRRISNLLDMIIQQTCMTVTPAPTTMSTTTPAPKPCTDGGDIVFLLDKSGSIGDKNFDTVKSFLANLVQDIPVEAFNIRISIVTFSDNTNVVFDLDKHNNRGAMITDIQKIVYTAGKTNTAEALRRITNEILTARRGDREDRPNVVVVMTDGNSANKKRTTEEADRLKKKAHVIVIQVGSWVDDYELNIIATAPHQKNKIEIKNFDALFTIQSLLQNLICKNADNCENVTCMNGGRCINDINSYYCECQEGYSGRHCQHTCSQPADIIFGIDKSGSITRPNFEKLLEFIKDIVYSLNFKMHRVGAISFSTSTQIHFQLDDYDNKKDVINSLDVYYSGGSTSTASMFREVKNRMFTESRKRTDSNGKEVPRIMILVTDGRSNNERQTWLEAVKMKHDSSPITILAVGIGNQTRQRELRGIVSDPPDSTVFNIQDYGQLLTFTDSIGSAICNRVDECETGERCQNGGTCVDKIGGRECICGEGFSGPNCERACDGKIDLGIMIDSSGSIRRERFPFVLDYITKVIGNITTGRNAARVGAISWSNIARNEFGFNEYFYKNDIIMAIQQIRFMGKETNTYSALFNARTWLFSEQRGDRDEVPDYVIMFTDGGSNINNHRTIQAAVKLRERGVHITIVAVGDDTNPYELRGIASDPTHRNIFWTLSYTGLPDLVEAAWGSTCNSINECESNPCQNRGTCEDMDFMYMCKCTNQFIGINCEKRCSRQMDVTFVLDISGSVDVVYNLIVNFTKHAVMGLPLEFGRTRVGLISYSDRAKIEFSMKAYTEKKEILNALVVEKPSGATNTQSALRLMHSQMFTSYNGDRPGVDNVAIVVSDGLSNVQQERTSVEAQIAHDRDIYVYTVAAGDEADQRELNEIASDPDPDYTVQLPSASDIPKAVTELMDLLCI